MAEKRKPDMTLNDLIAAARKEDWPTVDGAIKQLADNTGVISWAGGGLYNEDANLRDLAASIFEASKFRITPLFRTKLEELMENDESPYVRFRSACALFKNDDRSEKVISTLRNALDDPDTKDIAQGYLDSLKSS
jgi:hypothetical protein